MLRLKGYKRSAVQPYVMFFTAEYLRIGICWDQSTKNCVVEVLDEGQSDWMTGSPNMIADFKMAPGSSPFLIFTYSVVQENSDQTLKIGYCEESWCISEPKIKEVHMDYPHTELMFTDEAVNQWLPLASILLISLLCCWKAYGSDTKQQAQGAYTRDVQLDLPTYLPVGRLFFILTTLCALVAAAPWLIPVVTWRPGLQIDRYWKLIIPPALPLVLSTGVILVMSFFDKWIYYAMAVGCITMFGCQVALGVALGYAFCLTSAKDISGCGKDISGLRTVIQAGMAAQSLVGAGFIYFCVQCYCVLEASQPEKTRDSLLYGRPYRKPPWEHAPRSMAREVNGFFEDYQSTQSQWKNPAQGEEKETFMGPAEIAEHMSDTSN